MTYYTIDIVAAKLITFAVTADACGYRVNLIIWDRSMRCRAIIAAMLIASVFVAGPASACYSPAPLKLTDVKYADVVVVGRIANCEIVLDKKAHEKRRKWTAKSSGSTPEIRKIMIEGGFISDYARFDILVDEVLVGTASKTLTVTWDASTFAEAKTMPPGPFLIALRNPASKAPPLRGASATILPSPERNRLTVLQAPCAREFIFPTESREANEVRQILYR